MGILYIDSYSHGGIMKLRAQNTIEVITMVALVGVVVITAFMFMQGNNTNIAKLSQITTNTTKLAAKDTTINDSTSKNDITNKTIAEVSGTNAQKVADVLEEINQMDSSTLEHQLANELSSKNAYEHTTSMNQDNGPVKLANNVIEDFSLLRSPISIQDEPKHIISEIINVAVDAHKITKTQETTYRQKYSFGRLIISIREWLHK